MSRGKADLGGIDLPLDDVENGNVAILVGPAQVLLDAGAHLRSFWSVFNHQQNVNLHHHILRLEQPSHHVKDGCLPHIRKVLV